MNTNIQSDIAAARAKLDAVSAELRALEERAKQEATKPWEPKGGNFFISAPGRVDERLLRKPPSATETSAILAGSLYPTREAAESALLYVTFFKRLCCLAQELNPSGKVGGSFYLLPGGSEDCIWSAHCTSGPSMRTVDCLFQTKAAAEKAAEILNRDKWVTPSL